MHGGEDKAFLLHLDCCAHQSTWYQREKAEHLRCPHCADGAGEMGLMWVCLQLETALASLQGEPLQAEHKARLFVRGGVDVTNTATLTPELFAGAAQVVTARRRPFSLPLRH